MIVPKIKKVLILGGDALTLGILPFLKNKVDYLILSSKRNLQTKIDGISFEKYLIDKKANFKKLQSLDKSIDFKKNYNYKNSLYLCMSSPWIIKKKHFKKTKSLIVNSHGTRLPQYRGGASFSWMVMNKTRFGFNNLYKLDEKIDTGKILAYEEFLYPFNLKTPSEYFNCFKENQVKFLIKILNNLTNKLNRYNLTNQQEYLSSYFPRLNSDIHGWIDWSLHFEDLYSFINAFGDPHDGCRTYYKKFKVLIKDALPNYEDSKLNSYKSGMIYRKGPNWICVATNGGSIIIEKVIYKNQNIIGKLKVGERFFTPTQKIENKFRRVFYDSKGLVKK